MFRFTGPRALPDRPTIHGTSTLSDSVGGAQRLESLMLPDDGALRALHAGASRYWQSAKRFGEVARVKLVIRRGCLGASPPTCWPRARGKRAEPEKKKLEAHGPPARPTRLDVRGDVTP